MKNDFRFTLEAPITKKDCKRRGFPETIYKLLVQPQEATTRTPFLQIENFAQLLIGWTRQGEMLIANPIHLFIPKNGIQHYLDKQLIGGTPIGDFSISITYMEKQDLVRVMSLEEAEAIVFFYVSSEKEKDRIEQRLINAPPHGQYERPYLESLKDCEGFIFYAATHHSLEILGSATMIFERCLPPIIKGVTHKGVTH